MPRKNKTKNAYSFFLHEFAKSARLARDFGDVSAAAARTWNELTEQQRSVYTNRAKEAKAAANLNKSSDGQALYTSQGIAHADIERERNKIRDSEEKIRADIMQMVQDAFLDNTIATKPFYLIAANHFCKTMVDGRYIPAELAIIRYTLQDGCTRKWHTFINPGPLPAGYAFEALANSKSTHGLAPPPNARGERNFGAICRDALEFIGVGADGRAPPLFTNTNQLEALRSICAQLDSESSTQRLHVYPLVQLFDRLRSEVAKNAVSEDIKPFPTEHVAQMRLDHDPNDQHEEIACALHRDMDRTRHCALSVVQRYAFTMSDHLCMEMGIQLVAGVHLPATADVMGAHRLKEEQRDAKLLGLKHAKPEDGDDGEDGEWMRAPVGKAKKRHSNDRSSHWR